MTTSDPWGLHWFRRDLRVAGNGALRTNVLKHKGRVLGIFCFDRKFLTRQDFSHNRFQFFLETMNALKTELQSSGGDLLVLDVGPDEAFELLRQKLNAAGVPMPSLISWGRDYEPFARQRDERIRKLWQSWDVEVHTERDHLLIEPHELLSGQGKIYQIFTPFAKRWFELLRTPEIQERIAIQRAGLAYLDLKLKRKNPELFSLTWSKLLGDHCPVDQCENVSQDNKKHVSIPIPEAGSVIAWNRVKSWSGSLAFYGTARDIPSQDGTSKISMFLKNGSFTVPQLIAAYDLEYCDVKGDDGATKFLKELAWREFYYHILWHHPRVEHEAFQIQYKDLAWDESDELFERWKTGTTGFPIVDAGMRQLRTTGWMHNRVRMIVASFLVKDLLIDWRRGEQWFMNQLLDGDLAPNNGGWQWAASTGCDAQPYFRIFNPQLQSERFDPEGIYIKTFVPELANVTGKDIHNPSADIRKKTGYPEQIVDHARQKIRAMMLFKK